MLQARHFQVGAGSGSSGREDMQRLGPSQGRGLAEDGPLGLSEWGGDPEMAVPGLASCLAFLSRLQTPGVLGWGRVGRQKGSS